MEDKRHEFSCRKSLIDKLELNRERLRPGRVMFLMLYLAYEIAAWLHLIRRYVTCSGLAKRGCPDLVKISG